MGMVHYTIGISHVILGFLYHRALSHHYRSVVTVCVIAVISCEARLRFIDLFLLNPIRSDVILVLFLKLNQSRPRFSRYVCIELLDLALSIFFGPAV